MCAYGATYQLRIMSYTPRCILHAFVYMNEYICNTFIYFVMLSQRRSFSNLIAINHYPTQTEEHFNDQYMYVHMYR